MDCDLRSRAAKSWCKSRFRQQARPHLELVCNVAVHLHLYAVVQKLARALST